MALQVQQKGNEMLPYPCPKCPKRYRQESALRIHMKLHNNPTLYSCQICKKNFTGCTPLKNHMMIHDGMKPFKCPVCHLAFTQKGNMEKHLATHSNDKPFSCNYCEKKFSRKAHLQYHTANVHDKRKDYPCSICDKKFSANYLKQQHEHTHEAISMKRKLYSCNFCFKGFLKYESLLNHTRSHTKEKPFKCMSSCRRKFYSKSARDRHAELTHVNHMNSEHGANIQFKRKVQSITKWKSKTACYFCHKELTAPSLICKLCQHILTGRLSITTSGDSLLFLSDI